MSIPKPAVNTAKAENRSRNDFYPTPDFVTRLLMDFLRHDLPKINRHGYKEALTDSDITVWEPAAGNGAMADVIRSYGHRIVRSDIVDRTDSLYPSQMFLPLDRVDFDIPCALTRKYDFLHSAPIEFPVDFNGFLEYCSLRQWAWQRSLDQPRTSEDRSLAIITNPPFDSWLEFVIQALTHTDSVCMLGSLNYLTGQKRFNSLFKDRPPSYVLIFPKRVEFFPGANYFDYAWYIWTDTEIPGTRHWIKTKSEPSTQLIWIDPESYDDRQLKLFGGES
jgi:hypothetical protein